MSNTTTINQDPGRETGWERGIRKAKEEPAVPIGMALTTVALIGAGQSMRKGNRAQFNRMLRFRVAAQGFTVLAALGGSIYYGERRRLERQADKKGRQKDERNKELERSIKIAEAAQAGE
ncbi:MAG: Respiratory supercomplex factor 1, mitochondrial [Cyphobasidiales sp. Tagirdzhanova-0007]|nr:MAG: Respiratory supercomplex factor 1, mitochondrial [Cyphobasidiales sp. Tagirdzhanova-0007]